MLNHNMVSKLQEMKLGTMAASFQKQLAEKATSELSFEDRSGLLVDAEWITRKITA